MSMSNSFTRKGPGRRHDYSGVRRKIHENIHPYYEWLIRERCGALTETFLRRYWGYKCTYGTFIKMRKVFNLLTNKVRRGK